MIGHTGGAGANVAHGAVRVDQRGTRRGVRLRPHHVHGNLGKARIGVVALHVGVGQLLGFDHQMQRLRGIVSGGSKRKRLHDVQHFEGRDALSIGRQFEYGPTAIRCGNGVHPLTVKLGKVGCSHGAAVPCRRGEDFPRDATAIKRSLSAGGNLSIGPRQIGIAKDVARLRQMPINQIRAGRGLVGPEIFFAVAPVHAHHLANRKSVGGVVDGRGEYLRERLAAESCEKLVPAVHGTRHGHAIDTARWHGGNALGLQVRGSQSGRRPARCIQSVQLAGFRDVYDREEVAANAVVHRRDESHHGVRGNGGVDGIAALLEHARPNLGREHALTGHHSQRGRHHRSGLRTVLRAELRMR